ncbi:MAG: replication protein [Proteobacteria bacterium]|nr:replication protein [Pseudomonadota bacterium]MBU4470279.1 replication protein [Pseudomonadota bacterium]MCG2752692.1 replication protein [Desulfobacteraceae bacterium]
MASPQLENGYTKIANEILSALFKSRISGEGIRITLFIIRMSYGYSRKNCDLSYAEIGLACCIPRQRVARIIKGSLYPNRVLSVSQLGSRTTKTFEFNKNFDEWTTREKKVPVPQLGSFPVPQLGSFPVPQLGSPGGVLPIRERKEKEKRKKAKAFVPPTENDVVQYFLENGYSEESAKKVFKYYDEANPPWTDSKGTPVRSWKSKVLAVWFKPENKINARSGGGMTLKEKNMANFEQARKELFGNG